MPLPRRVSYNCGEAKLPPSPPPFPLSTPSPQSGITSPLLTCDRNDTLQRALELLAAAGGCAERLICVDAARRVTGVVSLSNIFSYFAEPGPEEGGSAVTPGMAW